MAQVSGYAISLAGRSHQKQGLPCQDAHCLMPLAEGWVLAAIADGVGSAPRAEPGSAHLVQSLGAFCSAHFPAPAEKTGLMGLLKAGFADAQKQVEHLAEEEGFPPAHYDSTLTAVLYSGRQAVLGHCGDGGVLGLNPDGSYALLTQAQKGETWSEVVPLRVGLHESVFAFAESPGLLLLTDGLLDVAVPPLLQAAAFPLYGAFLARFLCPALSALGPEALAQHKAELEGYLLGDGCAAITDDMTAVALWGTAAPLPTPPPQALEEPDWEGLRLQQYQKLYPHLYAAPAEDPE